MDPKTLTVSAGFHQHRGRHVHADHVFKASGQRNYQTANAAAEIERSPFLKRASHHVLSLIEYARDEFVSTPKKLFGVTVEKLSPVRRLAVNTEIGLAT